LEDQEEELELVPDRVMGEDEYPFGFEEDYYTEDYDDLLESFDADDDYEYTEDEDDSVLKIIRDEVEPAEKPDIEIKPRPEPEDDEFILETSQLLIMVGSAFVSFGVVMLVFFTCRRSLEQRARKTAALQAAKGPIVKSYQRVPANTLQYLQVSHIDMYRGEQGKQGTPLLE